jgi:6-phosphogluconate dehydrogenase
MQIGLIGLGEIGVNLALNLKRHSYDVVTCNVNSTALESIEKHGFKTVTSLKNLAESLETKRIIWIILSDSELIDQTIQSLQPYLSVGDIVIDGSDSPDKDTIRRSKYLEAFQIDFLDCGIDLNTGNSLETIRFTIGGNRFAFNYCEQLFKTITHLGNYFYSGKSGSRHQAEIKSNGTQSDTHD